MFPKLIINWHHLHQISDDNEEFELELLQTFIEETRIHLEGMAAAITRQDRLTLEREAHHIKGAGANLGLVQLQATAGELERQARQISPRAASDLLAELSAALQEVERYLTHR